jgi:xylulokinase
VDPKAEPFFIGDIYGGKIYAALLEGVGYTERLAFERMKKLGCAVGDVIFTSGGACRSDIWLKIRASILNRTLKVPSVVEAAMGSALLAASASFGSLDQASDAMIRYAKTVEPDETMTGRYDELYGQFYTECKNRYNLGE